MQFLKIFVAGALALGAAGMAAPPASAAEDDPPPLPNLIETSHVLACGSVTITLRNRSPWIYPVSYSTDGSTPNASGPRYGPVVDNRTNGGLNGPQKDQTGSRTVTFAEDSGVQIVKYVVAAGSERSLFVGQPVGEVTTVEVETDCLPNLVEVTPAAPEWVDPCGPDNGSWSYKNTDEYGYTETVEQDGSITITVAPTEGFVFPQEALTQWNRVDSNEACPVEPPVVTPPVVTPPAPQGPRAKGVQGKVTKIAKRGHHNFFRVAKRKGIHYTVRGKRIREGVWIKTSRKRVVIRVLADSSKFKVKGKRRLVLQFSNARSNSPAPKTSPRTGLFRGVA